MICTIKKENKMFERQLHYNVKIIMYFTGVGITVVLGFLILSYLLH